MRYSNKQTNNKTYNHIVGLNSDEYNEKNKQDIEIKIKKSSTTLI